MTDVDIQSVHDATEEMAKDVAPLEPYINELVKIFRPYTTRSRLQFIEKFLQDIFPATFDTFYPTALPTLGAGVPKIVSDIDYGKVYGKLKLLVKRLGDPLNLGFLGLLSREARKKAATRDTLGVLYELVAYSLFPLRMFSSKGTIGDYQNLYTFFDLVGTSIRYLSDIKSGDALLKYVEAFKGDKDIYLPFMAYRRILRRYFSG